MCLSGSFGFYGNYAKWLELQYHNIFILLVLDVIEIITSGRCLNFFLPGTH